MPTFKPSFSNNGYPFMNSQHTPAKEKRLYCSQKNILHAGFKDFIYTNTNKCQICQGEFN